MPEPITTLAPIDDPEPGTPHALPLHAYGFAATFKLPEMAAGLPGAEVMRDSDKDRIIARFPHGDGGLHMALLYDFGAVVFVGFARHECEPLVRRLRELLPPEPHAPLTERFLVEVRPDMPAQVLFDRVVIPELTVPALDIIGLLLAQSVVLGYYEEDADDIVKQTDRMTLQLTTTGQIPSRNRTLGRFIGSCMTTRSDIIKSLALFDKPDSTWDDPHLDRIYNAPRTELEIDDRFRALEKRLGLIQDNLVLFVDLLHNRSAWRLEFTIILLIVFEIALSLWEKFA